MIRVLWSMRIVSLLLYIAAALGGGLVAIGTWSLMLPAEPRPVAPPERGAAVTTSAPDPLSQAETIIESAWFGTRPSENARTRPEPAPAPEVRETRLSLVLRGVLAASDPQRGSAMIARQGGDRAELFRVSETVYGVAELVEVYSDRVVLRRDDALETLRFPGTGGPRENAADTADNADRSPAMGTAGSGPLQAGQAETPAGSSGGRQNSTDTDRTGQPVPVRTSQDAAQARLEEEIREAISQVQARAESDPRGLLRQYGLEATGEAYRVTSRASVLIANGLRPGDRITEINDQPVGNVERDQALIDSVLAGDEIKITLERGGATYRIYQALPE